MKNLLSKLSFVVIAAAITTSCSKTPYATFGGGPKKLTAEPTSRNIYANVENGFIRERSVALNSVQKENATANETQVSAIRSAISKIEKTQSSASAQKLSFSEKVTLARQVYKLKKEIAKVEKEVVSENTQDGGKSQIVAAILAFFVGGLGIHRFYLGYTWQGIVQLLTAGGCGIWALIDFIRILTGDLKPKDDDYEKTF